MHLSWIIPAYNEEERIERTILEVKDFLDSKNLDGGYEIIVSNSASKDRTAEIVKNLSERIAELRLLNLENKGKGWAVKQGMLEAKGKIRAFADADNSVSPDQADRFLSVICRGEFIQGCADIAIGSIEVPGSVVQEHAQWYRRILGKCAKLTIRFVSGLWEIRDSQRGFKFFSKEASEQIFPLQTLGGWGFDFEILLIAKRKNFVIKEIPVTWVNPAGSKVGISAYFTTLVELFKVKWNDIRGVYTGTLVRK